MLERNDDIELTIDALGSEGQGIGRHEGFAVFVPFALPGERVRAHIIKPGKSYAVAKLTSVLEASPFRVEPPCPAFGKCGGCALMHLDYKAQLEAKTATVRDALERVGGFKGVKVRPAVGMDDPARYRNKAAFPFAKGEDGVEFGFFAPRSHRLIPLEDCPIQQAKLVECAQAVKRWARENNIYPYDEETGKGTLRHIVARSAKDGSVMATVVTRGEVKKQNELIEALRAVEGVASIVHNRNDKKTNAIFGDEFTTLWGADALTQEILGLSFEVSAASFMQVNPVQMEKLYSLALEAIPEGSGKAADIYCGAGTLTLAAAHRVKDIVGIEYVREAVEDAGRNAARNNVKNARFICGDAAVELPKLVKKGFTPDVIILDPPRKGCDTAVTAALAASGAKRIIYVSCDPATLARDAKLICAGGYKLSSVQPVDMFPHTAHVETIVLLQR